MAKVAITAFLSLSVLMVAGWLIFSQNRQAARPVEPVAGRLAEGASPPVISSTDPILSNPQFTVEELPAGKVRYRNTHLPLHSRAGDESVNPGKPGDSLVWLSSFTVFAMDISTSEIWAVFSVYDDWSVESYDVAHYRYPEILLPVSMSYLTPYDRVLTVDLVQGEITGYFQLPENLQGVYALEHLADGKYFALSYQGDDSLRLSLLHLGDHPSVEKAVILRDIGLPSRRGYCAVDTASMRTYLYVRGLLVAVGLDDLSVVNAKELYHLDGDQLLAISGREELFLLSEKCIRLLDPQTFDVKLSFELPTQPALWDDTDGKSGQVFLRKGDQTYLAPSGITYRPSTQEYIVTFDYSPRMLLIDSDTGAQRFVEFASSSETVGAPVYLDEDHLLIGGQYVYSFNKGISKGLPEAKGTMLLDAYVRF